VIVEYLDHRTPLAHLIPSDHSTKIAVRRWEALADGACDAAVAVMLEQRRAAVDEALIVRQMTKVRHGLQTLEADLGPNKWCVNDNFSLADIAVGCLLGYIALRFAASINLVDAYPNLSRLNAALLKRASFSDSLPQA
jgi:glutathione S-transferase